MIHARPFLLLPTRCLVLRWVLGDHAQAECEGVRSVSWIFARRQLMPKICQLKGRVRWQALTLRRLPALCMNREKPEKSPRRLGVQLDAVCNTTRHTASLIMGNQARSSITLLRSTRCFLPHLFSQTRQECRDRRRNSMKSTMTKPSRLVPLHDGHRSHTTKSGRPKSPHLHSSAPYPSTRLRSHHHRTSPRARVVSWNKLG